MTLQPSNTTADRAAPSLRRAASVYIVAAAITAIIPFAVLPVLTRWLGPTGFGLAGSYLGLLNVATVLAGLSVHGIVSVAHFKQGPSAVPRYLRAALRLLLLTAGPLLAVLVAFAPWLSRWSGLPPAWLWTIGAVASAQFVVALGMAVFQAREEAWRYAALQVGLALSWGCTSLLLIGALGLGWEGRALGQGIAVLVMAAVALLLLRRGGLLNRAETTAAPQSELIGFGLPLMPHALAGAMMTAADRLVLTGSVGPAAAGQYYAAFQIAAVLTATAAAINQAWVPWLYRRLAQPSPEHARQVVRATYLIQATLLGVALLMAWAAPWLLPRVAGEAYTEAAPLLAWLAPAAALSGMYYFVTNHLFYTGRTGLLSIITVACCVMQLGLIGWLAPRWGAEGAAVAVLVTALCYLVAVWVAAQAVSPMPWLSGRKALRA